MKTTSTNCTNSGKILNSRLMEDSNLPMCCYLQSACLVGCQMLAILIPLNLSVKYVAKVFFHVKKLENFKNTCCHCQKQLLHGQISIFCWKIWFKALIDIVNLFFADHNMHNLIGGRFFHRLYKHDEPWVYY